MKEKKCHSEIIVIKINNEKAIIYLQLPKLLIQEFFL